jgi:RNA polymerase sigma-70 factor (ECF subfamily)
MVATLANSIVASCPGELKMSAEAQPSVDIAALTARMAGSDEDAYRMFHELYFHRMLRYLLVVTGGREEAAREALQLALLRVVRHIRKFDSEEAFWSWLTVLARSAVVDEERKRHRYLAFLDRFFQRAEVETVADSDADERLNQLLAANLDALSWDERELIQRKYFARESVKEIAADVGATEKAVESQLVRVRRKLKARILTQLRDET